MSLLSNCCRALGDAVTNLCKKTIDCAQTIIDRPSTLITWPWTKFCNFFNHYATNFSGYLVMAIGSNVFSSLLLIEVFGITNPIAIDVLIGLAIYAGMPIPWFSRGVALKQDWKHAQRLRKGYENLDSPHTKSFTDICKLIIKSPRNFFAGLVLLPIGFMATLTGAVNNFFWGFMVSVGVGRLSKKYDEAFLKTHPAVWMPLGSFAVVSQLRTLIAYDLNHNLFPIIADIIHGLNDKQQLKQVLTKTKFWGALIASAIGGYCYYTLVHSGTSGALGKVDETIMSLDPDFKENFAFIGAVSYGLQALITRTARIYQGSKREGRERVSSWLRITGALVDIPFYQAMYTGSVYASKAVNSGETDQLDLRLLTASFVLALFTTGPHCAYTVYTALTRPTDTPILPCLGINSGDGLPDTSEKVELPDNTC